MCNEVVHREPYTLWDVPDHFKTQEMCNEGMRNNPATFFVVLDRFKTQEMCTKAVEVDPWQLKDILITLSHKKCVIRQCGKASPRWYVSLIGL